MTTCKSCEYSQRQIDKLQKEIESLNKELALRQSIITEWIACSKDLPTVEQNGQKVLIYRIMNDSQASLAISIHETSMVKHCNVNETWWTELPKRHPSRN